jgi:hypothetical protein
MVRFAPVKEVIRKNYRYDYKVLDHWGDLIDAGVAETKAKNITEALDVALHDVAVKFFRFVDDSIAIDITKIEEVVK